MEILLEKCRKILGFSLIPRKKALKIETSISASFVVKMESEKTTGGCMLVSENLFELFFNNLRHRTSGNRP